ncbi:MAG: stalk domain-containing protein [Clostridiales bacterium]|nr:stalk domain-containing protein [Clostridiales bacterium]
MKTVSFKLLAVIALAVVFFAACPGTVGLAADPITVLVNGEPLITDVPPLIEEGRTLVPVRAIAESLGAYVGWDPAARRVEISLNDDVLLLVIDSTTAHVNGEPAQLDVPARILDSRTLVPARFISESLHAEVGWDAVTRTVTITTYADADPFSAELYQLEAAVLREINQRRAKLSRPALAPVEELTRMARGHSAELARTNSFTHVSARFGDTAARARARGLTVHFEYLALGLPDAVSIADSLLRGEHGARLLAAESLFCGLGLYKGATLGNADICAVAELTEGAGFILGTRPRRLDTAEITLTGYAAPGAPLTLYHLNGAGEYTSRYNYTLSVDNAGRFKTDLTLPRPGRYAAVVGLDNVLLIYE